MAASDNTFHNNTSLIGQIYRPSLEETPNMPHGEEVSPGGTMAHQVDDGSRTTANNEQGPCIGDSASGPPTDVASNSSSSVNQLPGPRLCVVCEDTASGVYFGALVCLPCKSFFIRSTKNGPEPNFTCMSGGNCDVLRENRLRCQHCRFERCLRANMSRRDKPETVVPVEGQELCKVCGDIANGVHFGVDTCEGCKKFFRRGLREAMTYECSGSRACPVTPRSRNECRYCRFHKCLTVGMSREAIRMGRPKKVISSANKMSTNLMLPTYPRLPNGSVPEGARNLPMINPGMTSEITPNVNINYSENMPYDAPSFGVYRRSDNQLGDGGSDNIHEAGSGQSNSFGSPELNYCQSNQNEGAFSTSDYNSLPDNNSDSMSTELDVSDIIREHFLKYEEEQLHAKSDTSSSYQEATERVNFELSKFHTGYWQCSCENPPPIMTKDLSNLVEKLLQNYNIFKAKTLQSEQAGPSMGRGRGGPPSSGPRNDGPPSTFPGRGQPSNGQFGDHRPGGPPLGTGYSDAPGGPPPMYSSGAPGPPQGPIHMPPFVIQKIKKRMVEGTACFIEFLQSVEGFNALPFHVKLYLCRYGGFIFKLLLSVFEEYDASTRKFKSFFNYASTEAWKPMADAVHDAADVLAASNYDLEESILLGVLATLASDWNLGLYEPQIETLRGPLLQAFHAHTAGKSDGTVTRAHVLLSQVPMLRNVTILHARFLENVKFDINEGDLARVLRGLQIDSTQ